MKRTIITSVLLLITIGMTATNHEWEDTCSVRRDLNRLFSRLEKNRVPNGLLMDYSVNLIELDNYDGTALIDSNYVDFNYFDYIYRALRSADVTGYATPCPANSIRSMMCNAIENGKNAVGIVLSDYYAIVPNALTDSLLVYAADGCVEDVYRNGSWVNPYEKKTVFAFSPYLNQHRGGTVTYSFDTLYSFCNRIGYVLEFDPGDGTGYHTVTYGQDIVATYPSDGEYEVKMRAREIVSLFSPRYLYAHSSITVYDVFPEPYNAPSLDIETGIGFSCRQPSGAICPQAKICIKRATEHEGLIRPLIVAEGFDPLRFGNPYSNTYYYDKGATTINSFLSNIDNAIKNNYDIIYVDWLNSTAAIQDNADILIQIIQWVNDRMINPDDRIQLMGQSMGGLIARYALCRMEQTGLQHNVENFISHDAPHLGVNIPIGMMYAVRYAFALYNRDFIVDLLVRLFCVFKSTARAYYDDIKAMLDSESVKQMLINYIDESFSLNNAVHESWQAELNQIGFPKGDGTGEFKMVTLSNGGTREPATSFFGGTLYASASASLLVKCIFWNIDKSISSFFGVPISFLLQRIPGRTTVTLSMYMLPWVTNASKVFESTIKYKKRLLWLFDVDKTLSEIAFNSPSSGFPMDIAYGSYYDVSIITDQLMDISYYSGWVGGLTFSMSLRDFMFVPTVSSICLDSGTGTPSPSDYTKDWKMFPEDVLSRCPFNAFYFPNSTEKHIGIDTNSNYWLTSILPMKVEGPTIAWSDSVYVLNSASATNVTYSLSDNNIGYFSGNSFHALEPGKVDVLCTGKLSGQPFRLKKSIVSGSLDCFLTDTLSQVKPNQDKEYIVSANYVIPGMEDLFAWNDTLGNFPTPPEDYPVYHWSVDTFPSMTSSESSGILLKNLLVCVPYGMRTSVSLTVEYKGYFSQPVTIIIENPMQHLPLLVGPDGTIFVQEEDTNTLVPVRNEIDEPIYDFYFANTCLTYKGQADVSRLLHDLLDKHVWVEELKQLKPWGTQEYLLIPYTVTNRSSGETIEESLKFIYHD